MAGLGSPYPFGGNPYFPAIWGLVSHWKLDEASGDAIDSYGGLHLTDTNTVTSAVGPTTAIPSARQFTAANSEYFVRPDDPRFSCQGVNQFDLWTAGWIYLDAVSVSHGIIQHWDPSRIWSVDVRFEIGTKLESMINDSRIVAIPTGGGASSLIVSTWYYFFTAWDSVAQTVYGYANTIAGGMSDNSGTTAYYLNMTDSASTLEVGRFETGVYMDGRIASLSLGKLPAGNLALIRGSIRDRIYNNGLGRAFPWG